ncbi:MAG: hypothetical protein MUF83_21480 [Acidimicrobiales bacterium]|jgi:hypothetical protein|nr:hypothetical protein [Acidimicrobiales bacterium]
MAPYSFVTDRRPDPPAGPGRRRVLVGVATALALLVGSWLPAAAQDTPVDPGADPIPDAAVPSATEPDLGKLVALTTARRSLVSFLPDGFVPVAELPVPPPSCGPPYRTGPGGGSPEVVPPPALGPGDGTVYAIGDSVLLGAEPYLRTTLGGWDLRLDARVGRRVPEGLAVLQANRASVGQVVVFVLGHNYGGGGAFYGYLDALMAEVRGAHRVVLVTVAEWSPAQAEVNRAIRVAPLRYPNVVVADWAATAAANPRFLAGDRVHLTAAGNTALANLVAVVTCAAPERAGVVPPPPVILPLPDDSGGGPSPSPVPSASSTTTSTATTSTTQPTTTTSTTTSSTTTTAPTTSTSSTTTSTSPPPVAGGGA